MDSSPHRQRNETNLHYRHDSIQSSSRDKERSNRHRRKSRKKRRYRSRSRSLSSRISSLEKRPPVVYMNPAFQYSGANVLTDLDIRKTLVSHLTSSEQRISSLELELRAAQLARGRADQTIFEVNAEKIRIEAQNVEILQVMRALECAVEDLQAKCNALKNERDRQKSELELAEKAVLSCREQNNFMNDRNMKLVKKCEELSEENKTIHNRRDESARELADVRPRFEGIQIELRQRVEDGRKMFAQLRSYEEKERLWKKQKADFEKRIEIKDAAAAAERRNNEEWRKRVLAEKSELERKVQLADPEITKALDAEAIKKAMEDLKTFYERRLDVVLRDLEALKKRHDLLTNASCANNVKMIYNNSSGNLEVPKRAKSVPRLY